MAGYITRGLKRSLDSAMYSSLDICHGLSVRLNVLHIVIDLYIERRFVNFDMIVRMKPLDECSLIQHISQPNIGRLRSLLRNLRVGPQRLPGRLGLSTDLLSLEPNVILD